MSFLAVDVGNTRLKWALYSAAEPGAELLMQGAVFLETVDRLAETDWKLLPRPSSMLGCVVAGEGGKRRVSARPHGPPASATATATRTGWVPTAGLR